MYNSDSTPTTGKIIIGIIISIMIITLSKIGVFKDVYTISASIFKDFQQQNMQFFKGLEQDITFLTDLGNLRAENESLKIENLDLKSENISQAIALEEANKIAKQLAFNPSIDYVPVRITQYSENQTEIILNKGSIDLVKIGDVLVIDNYLVGSVTEVNVNYSKAILIISTNLKIPAESKTDKLKGVAVGDGINAIILQQVPNDKKLIVGDYVFTAGLGGTFPYGLIIGKIVKIDSKDADIEQKAQISPEINIKNLREIYIIKEK
jgi:rod shape-determining protein MreC